MRLCEYKRLRPERGATSLRQGYGGSRRARASIKETTR
jgi:hypothetical protein